MTPDARRAQTIDPLPVPLSRRSLVRLAGALALAFSLRVTPARTERASFVTEIAPGVFVHEGRIEVFTPDNEGDVSNASFVVGLDAVAVIDTGGSLIVGERLKAAIRERTALPIRYVINTHMHPDHIFGNAAFADDGVEFIAHFKMERGLAARADRYMERNRELLGDAAFKGIRIIMPTRGVAEPTTLDLGGRTLELVPRPTAHTDNDLTIRDTASGTLFLGDLLFSGHVPVVDGSIKGWLAVLKVLMAEPAARVVPGHGPPSLPWPAGAEPQVRYLEALAADVRALIKAGKTLSDAMKTAGRSEKDAWQLFEDYNARNASAAFAELEWE